MLNINLFGGPGTGKSTSAAGLFYQLKKQNQNVEYIQEFAKELVYSDDNTRLSDKILLFGEQNHRLHRIKNRVDIAINDSPFVMGACYIPEDFEISEEKYVDLLVDTHLRNNNLDILLVRNPKAVYQQEGRYQDYEGALRKDEEIKQFLIDHNIKYHIIYVDDNTVENILTTMELFGLYDDYN